MVEFLLGTFHPAGARAAVATDGIAIVALFVVRLNHSIPTAWSKPTIGRASVVAAGVDTIVTLLAEQAIDLTIATISAQLAARRASGRTREAVIGEIHAVVAFLGRILLNRVPTTRTGGTIGIAMAIGAVIDAIVAGLVASHDAITTLGHALALYRDEPSEREVEVRSGAVTLGVEQGNLVHVAHGEPQVHRHGCINGEGPRDGGMEASQIEGQTAIDEYPHVVIAGERERLATFELEPRADLAGETEVVPGAGLLSGSDPAQVVYGEKLGIGEVVGAIGLFGERQLGNDFDVDASCLVVPLVEIANVCRLLSIRTRADQRSLADSGVSRFAVRSEHWRDQPWSLHTATESLEIRMTNASVDGQSNDVPERYRHIERIWKRAGHGHTHEPRFDLAHGRAAVAIFAVSVIASLVVTWQNEAIAACRRAGPHAATRLDLAEGIAPVPDHVIAVVAGFVALLDSVVAHREMAGHAQVRAFVACFAFAGIRATVARNGGIAAILAFLLAGKDPVAASRSGAWNAGYAADPAVFQGAGCRAAVTSHDASVVAGFLPRDDAIAASDCGYASLSGIWASEILFDRGAVGGTAVARIAIAVIAYFTSLDRSVPTAGGIDAPLAPLAALTSTASGRRAAHGEQDVPP